ncbi:MAG TPA: GMP synthase [Chitinophagaceae bacterium]|jgi:GMP synthase-like glutamine amidotransferase|nr:GMP synthase [Chitinophagaceae bacterium]
MIRIAILDLYEGQPNQGMRCLREIINQWSEYHHLSAEWEEFDVRAGLQVPDLSFDIYISSGGPGSPLDSEGSAWEQAYFNWLGAVEAWNRLGQGPRKPVFLICHSFQLVCRAYGIATVNRRKSTSFGVFPVHLTEEGRNEPVFEGLPDPFYVVDSRDWQVVQPDHGAIDGQGARILCIEKERPHVPYERAIMALRFNDWMVGTQFHPEADAVGMSLHLQTEDKKQTVIENHGEEKWKSMIEGLNDPEKIMWTYAHILPNFLNEAVQQIKEQSVGY